MHSFRLALLAAVALAGYSDTFECDRSIVLDDSKPNNKLKCRMTSTPPKPVQVNFEADSLQFGNCAVTLTNTDWTEIPVNVVPICSDRDTADVKVNVRLFSDCQNPQDVSVTLKRKISSCEAGSSKGDPHFHLFNDRNVNFQGEGVFDMFYHPQLQIQTIQGHCFGNVVSCNHAISIRYGSSIMAIDMRTGQLSTMQQVTPNVDGIDYTPPTIRGASDDNTAHTVTLPCGSRVVLTTFRNSNDKWINVDFILAASYKDYGGMLNRPKLGSNQFMARGDRLVTDVDDFMNSWKARAYDININKGFTPFTPLPIPGLKCTLPTTCVNPTTTTTTRTDTTTLPQYVPITATTTTTTSTVTTTTTTTAGNVAGTTTTTTTTAGPIVTQVGTTTGVVTTTLVTTTFVAGNDPTTSPPGPVATLPPPPPEYTYNVNKHCSNIFVIKGCNDILPAGPSIQDCKADCLATGNFAMAESHRQSYMAKCKILSDLMRQDPEATYVEKAKAIQSSCGLGGSSCLNSCSGHGKCTANGCTCDPGYSGMDCAANLAALPAYDPTKNAYVTSPSSQSVFPSNPAVVAPTAGTGSGNQTAVYNGAQGYTAGCAMVAVAFMLVL